MDGYFHLLLWLTPLPRLVGMLKFRSDALDLWSLGLSKNVYCYSVIRLWGVDICVVDRILMNFNRTVGLLHSILYTKLFAVLLLAISCLGPKGVKDEKITWSRIGTTLAAGSVLLSLRLFTLTRVVIFLPLL